MQQDGFCIPKDSNALSSSLGSNCESWAGLFILLTGRCSKNQTRLIAGYICHIDRFRKGDYKIHFLGGRRFQIAA